MTMRRGGNWKRCETIPNTQPQQSQQREAYQLQNADYDKKSSSDNYMETKQQQRAQNLPLIWIKRPETDTNTTRMQTVWQE